MGALHDCTSLYCFISVVTDKCTRCCILLGQFIIGNPVTPRCLTAIRHVRKDAIRYWTYKVSTHLCGSLCSVYLIESRSALAFNRRVHLLSSQRQFNNLFYQRTCLLDILVKGAIGVRPSQVNGLLNDWKFSLESPFSIIWFKKKNNTTIYLLNSLFLLSFILAIEALAANTCV